MRLCQISKDSIITFILERTKIRLTTDDESEVVGDLSESLSKRKRILEDTKK